MTPDLCSAHPGSKTRSAMADDSYSASQLRRRYTKGGSARDSELSASQLRSRYEIDNSKFGK